MAAPTTAPQYVELRVHNLHQVEVLTPKIDKPLGSFTRALGLHEAHREGRSVYLSASGCRCWRSRPTAAGWPPPEVTSPVT